MAMPSPGKCSILLVLVLILYTGYAFRIRDALSSTNIDQSRSSVCSSKGHARCMGDESPTESSSPGSLPTESRRQYDAVGSSGFRGRISSKIPIIKQTPVVDVASEEASVRDDNGGEDDHSEDVPPPSVSRKFHRWTTSESRRVRFGRLRSEFEKDEAKSEEIDKEENSHDDEHLMGNGADEDDDGVEIANDDEDSEEDEDDRSEVKTESDEDDRDEDSDSVKLDHSPEIISERTTTFALPKNRNKDKAEILINKIPKESVNRESSKTTMKRKITVEAASSEDEETDSEMSDLRKPREPEAEIRKRNDALSKKVLKENTVQESDENDDNDDRDNDNEENEDEGKEEASLVSLTPAFNRKLEKVRLADKDKPKSMEIIRTAESIVTESIKSAHVEANTTSSDETKIKKRKDPEATARATKFETEESQSTTDTKPETHMKINVSPKLLRNETSNVKSKMTKEPMMTKDRANTKVKRSEKDAAVSNKSDVTVTDGVVKKSKRSGVKLESGVQKSEKNSTMLKKRADASLSLTQLNDAILQVPTFVPNFTAIEDAACKQHGKIFLRQLRGYKLWALQMLDSSAKIPSGLLRGNVNQLGDFDQCLGVTARVKVDKKTVKVQGKYCLATLDIHASTPGMKVPVNFMQSRGFIRATMRDPGHFVPRFTTANWAICIPAACSAEDAKNVIENALSSVNIASGLRFSVDVDPEMCYVRQKFQAYTKETIGVLYFYAMIICVVIVATIRDYISSSGGKGNYPERIIMAFSLRRTLKILTREENTSAGEITCIHGIRSLATIALYVAHKMIPVSQIPYANRIFLTESANNPTSSLLRTSVAYTDCFLLLSGLLTGFNMARESLKRGNIRWFCRIVGRFVRLTPALLVTVFWYAYVMEHIGSGPQWHRVIAVNAQLCKQNLWTNLLYIQNFFPFEEMCATHTHQLALDMQLSLIAPILVFFLTFKPLIGILVIFFVLQVSATIRYFAITNNNLSLVIYHGMTMKQLYKTANLTYALPLHRATPYVFGVALGVLLHYTGRNVQMYRIFVILGWTSATFLGAWSLFSPWRMARRDYVYDVEEAAHYAVIAPVAWSLAICWIIFACFTNHGGFINKFLTSYWMILFSRISYAVYLCQFAIFFYNVGTARYSNELQLHRFIDPYEAIVVTLVSLVLTILIDIPMQEVKNVIMESSDCLTSPITTKETEYGGEEGSPREEPSIPVVSKLRLEKKEREEVGGRPKSWSQHNDASDGLTRSEEPEEGEEYLERWSPRSKSNGQGRMCDRRETYEVEDDRQDTEENEEEEEEDRPTEWSWVRKTRNRIPVEDDGLLEYRRSRSSQREYYVEPDVENHSSSTHRYHQRDDGSSSEKRSMSAQRARSLGLTESPRSSVRRERSTSRTPQSRIRHPETDEPSCKRLYRSEPRGRSIDREQERATVFSRKSPDQDYLPKRERSVPKNSKSKVPETDAVFHQYFRPPSRVGLSERDQESTRSRESLRHERSPSRIPTMTKPVEFLSSGSEEEVFQHQQTQRASKMPRKQQPVVPKVSDEEDWEEELRIRRKKFMERLASEDRDVRMDEGGDGWSSIKRRSSAEGKLALLTDPTGSNVMDSWTVSRGPRVSLLGSSQETEDDTSSFKSRTDNRLIQQGTSIKEGDRSDDESSREKSRRRSYTSGSQVTSLEEEDDIGGDDFVLNEGSKRITVMDLSKLSQEESFGEAGAERNSNEDEGGEEGQRPIMATLKLFKRESIVKSQASEEDPEYLLPERPKLMEQEQDHPFKKAWQLQKSRSEEDPTPYVLKEVKTQQDISRRRAKAIDDKVDEDIERSESNEGSSGPRSTSDGCPDAGAEVWLSRNPKIEDGKSPSESCQNDDTDVTQVSRHLDLGHAGSSSKLTTEDSRKLE